MRTAPLQRILTLSIVLLAGCGTKTEVPEFAADLVSVTGKVTVNGAPLPGALITFVPAGGQSGETATSVTDEAGQYQLITARPGGVDAQATGALPGTYKVTISRLTMPDGAAVPPGTTDADAMALGAKESLPSQLSDYEKTQQQVEVEATPGFTHDFELKVKDFPAPT
ncbi:carboxypeptidase-like regulatory domain-containing protein [Rubinisphaera margarita]|uniref:carboxypeptidase-like regulatory domain-containing protein n=1 Tax=Rubinisphaera margarita TaxID=2909586 RepID=UPI001EE844ED|nr:carboxypeptidase-like regulatory domain-containing protein [Rubinisphaera margarita]MCG6156573.1 carboxypeptidase-like regulatory domain-containing protein [Rubinisphaera margarita]